MSSHAKASTPLIVSTPYLRALQSTAVIAQDEYDEPSSQADAVFQ